MARFDNILETIGNTPLVKLHRLAPPHVNLYVKVESFNPMRSVKDRMARAMIETAERDGLLHPGQTIVEATSGNTGIGLAMVCAQKGYPLVVTMAESFSVERRKLLRFLGARVVLTPAAEKGSGMYRKAVELAEKHGWFLCRQFENEANADVHSQTTAQEILRDMAGEKLDYWVSGFGTGGTLKGVARVFKQESPHTRIVAAEPDVAPVLGSGIPQSRAADGSPAASHPSFRPHPMQGWSPDFVAKLTEDAVRSGHVDEIVTVSGADAMRLSRELAQREGIFVGTSSGATLAAALVIAQRAPKGANIVCMLPDTGERYLSTPLFENIPEQMTAEELALSASTPGYRFVAAPAPAPVVPASAPQNLAHYSTSEVRSLVLENDATDFVDEMIGIEAVVVFGFEGCESSADVRRFFEKLGIHYRSIDLDSACFRASDRGKKILAVLAKRFGTSTIPQVIIAGRHFGSSTALVNAWRDGSLARHLSANGIAFDRDADFEDRLAGAHP